MKNDNNFKPLPFWREILLKRDELPDYYNAKRKYKHDNGKSVKGLKWRSAIHPILIKLMEFDRKYINKQTLTIINDKSNITDKPVIYAVTHIGKFDYQIVSEAIRKHQIPFAGDPETSYRTADGFLLGLNGIVYCDTENKTDRKVAMDTSIELLNKGHNLLIYPEGVWNLTPNLLMLPLFPGTIKMAKETGCDIIPVAIEQYDNNFFVNIGHNFKVPDILDEDYEKEYIELKKMELRDTMATLKWEIIEKIPKEERKNIKNYALQNKKNVDKRLYEWFNKRENKPFYDEDIINHRTFKVKNVTLAKEAFLYLKNIKLNKNNAFIFRKDLSLPNEVQDSINKKIYDNLHKVR